MGVAGSRMLLKCYESADLGAGGSFFDTYASIFENSHGATSIPAAEHSTITSWADVSPDGGDSMRAMLTKRLEAIQVTLIRPDSGEGVETLPQLLSILNVALPEHWEPLESLVAL